MDRFWKRYLNPSSSCVLPPPFFFLRIRLWLAVFFYVDMLPRLAGPDCTECNANDLEPQKRLHLILWSFKDALHIPFVSGVRPVFIKVTTFDFIWKVLPHGVTKVFWVARYGYLQGNTHWLMWLLPWPRFRLQQVNSFICSYDRCIDLVLMLIQPLLFRRYNETSFW